MIRFPAAGLVASLILWVSAATADCAEDQVILRGDFGQTQFTVEIADDAKERAQGLMFRTEMAPGDGMLFLYPKPQPVAFWMKNTYIPLDMIFLDARGVVQHIHTNAVPGDLTPIEGGDAILAVLEINAGLSAAVGLEKGNELQHPALGPDSAWPCTD